MLTGRAKSIARRAEAKASQSTTSTTGGSSSTTKTPTTMQEKYDANEALAQARRFGQDIPTGATEYQTDLNTTPDTPVQSTASYRSQTKDRMAELERIKTEAEAIQLKLDERKASDKGTVTDPTYTPPDPNDPFAGVESRIAAIELQHEQDKETLFADYDNIQATANKEYRSIIRGIKQQFQARIDMMKETNSRVLRAQRVNNIRSGTARYAAEMAAGLMTEEEQQGHLRLSQIESEMSQALVAAAEAKASGDLERFNAVYDQLDSLTKNMNDQIKENFDMAVKRNEEIRKDAQERRAQEKADLDAMLNKSSAAAPALAARIATLPPDQQAAVIEAYASAQGIDPEILMGDVVGAAQDQNYKALQAKNIENQIWNRNRTEDRLQTKAAQDAAEETGYSTYALNIVEGQQTINDVADKDRADVIAELRTLGFYNNEPPQWFIEGETDDLKALWEAKGRNANEADLFNEIRRKWEETRQKAITKVEEDTV